jgi:hypothetical protein
VLLSIVDLSFHNDVKKYQQDKADLHRTQPPRHNLAITAENTESTEKKRKRELLLITFINSVMSLL